MPVYFESLSFCQLLRGCIHGDGFKKYLQNIVHIFVSMRHMESTMIQPSQSDKMCHYWVSIGIEAGDWSQIEPVILESFLNVQW